MYINLNGDKSDTYAGNRYILNVVRLWDYVLIKAKRLLKLLKTDLRFQTP